MVSLGAPATKGYHAKLGSTLTSSPIHGEAVFLNLTNASRMLNAWCYDFLSVRKARAVISISFVIKMMVSN